MIETITQAAIPLTRRALAACWRFRNTPDRDRLSVARWAGLSAEDCQALERLDANLHGCPLPEAPKACDIPRYLAGIYLPAALDALAVSRHDAARLARAIAPPWLGAEETLMESLKNGWPAELIAAEPLIPKAPRLPCIRDRLLEECRERGWEPAALPEGAVTALAEALEVLPQSVRTALRRLALAADAEAILMPAELVTETDATDTTDLPMSTPRADPSPPAAPERLGDRIVVECARRGWEIGNLPRGAVKILAAALGTRTQTVGMVASVMHRTALVAQAMGERPPPPKPPALAAAASPAETPASGCALIAAAAASVTHVLLEAGLESIANEDLQAELRKLCLAVLAQVPLQKG